MTVLALCVLAIVQGITEFLPISSSGHLILVPVLTGWDDQGLLMDVAVHVGTLGAVVAYWWRDVLGLIKGAIGIARNPTERPKPGGDRHLLICLVVGTFPVVIAGALITIAGLSDAMRGAAVIGWTSIIFGILLYWADRKYPTDRVMSDITLGGAFMIGMAQILALIPGTSRSGITMTVARMLGFSRTDAARFSMLLAIPTILAAGTLATLSILDAEDAGLGRDAIIGAGLSFLTAIVAIALMMRWLKTASFLPFVIYRVVLGVGLLVWVYI